MIKIGNLLRLLFCMTFVTSGSAQQILLSVCDTNGMPIAQCVKGVAYSLYVTMRDISSTSHLSVSVELPKGVRMHQGRTVSRRIENGNTTITYIYSISADETGIYTVGPAHVEDGVTDMISNPVTLTVKESDSCANNSVRALLTLHVPAAYAYVGQEVPCVLRFCYVPNQISLQQIGKSEIADVTSSEWTGPFSGSEEIGGMPYAYVEWRWSFQFSKPGKYEIPAYRGDYSDITKRRQGHGAFALFFNDAVLQTLYSNSHRILIKPLPAHPSGTRVVGRVSAYTVACDRTECSVGDAALLSLTILGEGNFAHFAAPLLNDIPCDLKYYDSKKEVVTTAHASGVRFEYVLQPLQAGICEIPAQQYTYFDPYEECYKTVMSNPFYFTVLPSKTVTAQTSGAQQSAHGNARVVTDLCALHTHGPWCTTRVPFMIPWYLFFVLSGLPLLCVCAYCIQWYLVRWHAQTDGVRRSRNAFAKTKKRIKKVKEARELYTIWLHCFADRWSVSYDTLTEVYIRQRLQSAGLSASALHEWEMFWHACMRAEFVRQNIAAVEMEALRSASLVWADILETYL